MEVHPPFDMSFFNPVRCLGTLLSRKSWLGGGGGGLVGSVADDLILQQAVLCYTISEAYAERLDIKYSVMCMYNS